jgi:Carboxypeptidase regulatory-like domain
MNEISLMLRTAVVSFFLGFSAQSLHGQNCSEMVYGHQNQIDPSPIGLRQVKGRVLDPSGTVMPQVCVGIFTEPEHRLVRYAQTDETGLFALDTKGLPDGEYRFVGQSPGFCPANARIRSKSRSHQKKTLVVHMNVRGIDTCSYVEPSKN